MAKVSIIPAATPWALSLLGEKFSAVNETDDITQEPWNVTYMKRKQHSKCIADFTRGAAEFVHHGGLAIL